MKGKQNLARQIKRAAYMNEQTRTDTPQAKYHSHYHGNTCASISFPSTSAKMAFEEKRVPPTLKSFLLMIF